MNLGSLWDNSLSSSDLDISVSYIFQLYQAKTKNQKTEKNIPSRWTGKEEWAGGLCIVS